MPAKLNREAELGFPRWDWQGSPRVPSEHPHTPAPGGPASLPVTLWRLPGVLLSRGQGLGQGHSSKAEQRVITDSVVRTRTGEVEKRKGRPPGGGGRLLGAQPDECRFLLPGCVHPLGPWVGSGKSRAFPCRLPTSLGALPLDCGSVSQVPRHLSPFCRQHGPGPAGDWESVLLVTPGLS